MRYYLFMILLALILIPGDAAAGGAVIFVVDGMGSSYISPHVAAYTDGTRISPVGLQFVNRADASYLVKVPVPETEYGHAVIVTGYSNASRETVAYYDATIFDTLKDDGYLTLGILENGDSGEMLDELDAAVREKNNSIYTPYFEYVQNDDKVPEGVAGMMQEYPRLPASKAGKDKYSPYIKYDDWSIKFAEALVTYMNKSQPDIDYILIVNAGGLDHAGHSTGYEGYRIVLSGLDTSMGQLIDACMACDTILMVTGDHGMSFSEDSTKGAHASLEMASRNESLLVPMLIYTNKTIKGAGGTYGQECLAPTMLSLLDEPNTMSLSDGEPLPVKEKASLYIRTQSAGNVTVTGPNYNRSLSFIGIYGFKGLEKGDYTVGYNGVITNVRLGHDELIELSEVNAPVLRPWAIYAAATTVSVIGICIALKLAWMRK